jgi:hypothetical protein
MSDLIALEAQLSHLWKNVADVIDVRVSANAGGRGPAILLRIRGKVFPKGIPARVTTNIGLHRVVLPVLWQSVEAPPPVAKATATQNKPLHRSMWDGAPPVIDRFMPVIRPQPHRPMLETAEMPPAVKTRDFELFLPARDPRLPFWSEPFDLDQCICLDRLALKVPVISYEVPSDHMVTLTGISYSAFGANVGDRITFVVSKSGAEIATWTDMVMSNADSAHQFAFAGHINPLPLNAIFDHDQSIDVHVIPLGGPPYNPTTSDITNLQVCVLLRGWTSQINDRREGAPKAYDLGAIGEIAFGYRDPCATFTDAALSAAVQQVVDATAAAGGVPA